MMKTGQSVSLVLGSGGARGLTHIGVIHYLVAQGYHIQSVAGSSMGALVGGLYAAGKLDDYCAWVKAVTRLDILRLLDLSFGSAGFVKGERLINTLRQLLGDAQIEELAIPFTAVATDLKEGRELWLAKGSLFEAIRASISMPMFFHPMPYHGRLLIDGGVVNPVPLAPVFKDHSDLIIAVNLNGAPRPTAKLLGKTVAESPPRNGFHQKISEFVGKLPGLSTRGENDTEDPLSMFDVANQALDVMQDSIARHKLAAYPPDILIEVPRNLAGVLEFHRATSLIDAGYQLAAEAFASHPPKERNHSRGKS